MTRNFEEENRNVFFSRAVFDSRKIRQKKRRNIVIGLSNELTSAGIKLCTYSTTPTNHRNCGDISCIDATVAYDFDQY